MRPFLGADHGSEAVDDGTGFLCGLPPPGSPAALERALDQTLAEHKRSISKPLLITALVLTVATFIAGEVLGEAPTDSPVFNWLLPVALALLAAAAACYWRIYVSAGDLSKTYRTGRTCARVERELKNYFDSFGVPEGALDVQVFTHVTLDKNGELCGSPFKHDFKAWRAEGGLWLCDVERKYFFPGTAFCGLKRVGRRFQSGSESSADGAPSANAKYCIHRDLKAAKKTSGHYRHKGYIVAELEYGGCLRGIFFPPEQAAAVQELTGLQLADNG